MLFGLLCLAFLCWASSVKCGSVAFGRWQIKASDRTDVEYSVEKLPIDITKSYAEHNSLDPFYFKNDTELLWIGNVSEWTVRSIFDIDRLEPGDISILTLEGIDTIANITINNQTITTTSNAFVRYRFDISEHLKSTQNEIKITLKSPVAKAVEAYNAYESQNHYAVPPANAYSHDGTAHINMLRKMQASFGWDFAPSFPTLGIGNVQIRTIGKDECQILDFFPRTANQTPQWMVTVAFEVVCGTDFDDVLPIYVRLGDKSKRTFKQHAKPGMNIFETNFSFNIAQDELWYPHGYGNQVLFDIFVRVADQTIDMTKKVGFRGVKLMETPLKPKGNSYYFAVNGSPVFLKGSNWVQASPFTIAQTCAKTRLFFEAMKAAHFNALRVWGGGKYERDCFYELADAYGILIWQDFMFACNLYPVNQNFKENMEEEIEYQVKRLLSHPSILLFAGNNELEAALAQRWYPEITTRNKDDYFEIFNKTIAPIVRKFTHDVPYIMTSPSNGINSCGENKQTCVSSDPMSDFSGDIHQYNYNIDPWDWKSYPTPRLTSEFGFQALPSIRATASQLPADQLFYISPELERRQHHPNGYQQIEDLISRNLKFPKGNKSLEAMTYLSQLTQSMGIRTQTEHYRRFQGRYLPDGRGNTMGTLYWQLNDVWAAPSWASINIDLEWKMLHYHAREFFAPFALSVIKNSSDIEVYLAKDKPEFEQANLTIRIFGYSVEPLKTEKISILGLNQRGSQLIHKFSIASLPEGSVLLTVNLELPNGTLVTPEYQFFLKRVKDLDWSQFGKGAHVKSFTGTSVTIGSDGICPFLWLSSDTGGTWSNNGFTLVQKEMTLDVDKPFTKATAFCLSLIEDGRKLVVNV